MQVRAAVSADADSIWRILEPMICGGETYALPRDITREDALAYWMSPDHEVFVAQETDTVVGTYYLRPNQKGGGAHVANCGYVTATDSTGNGVARAMCLHSLERTKQRGFRAMQFNFVVASNDRAVRLWRSLGFDTAGRLAGAFKHPSHGFVDALVMYRTLKGPLP